MILMLNIFLIGSVEGTAHCFKKQLGLEGENMMSLELFLHAGNISVPMSVHSRKKFMMLILTDISGLSRKKYED